jgi:putative ABC transport system permease protein
MMFVEMLRVAAQSIRANFFRAFLTMLGVIIGVAAVITMVALGTGAQRAINEQIDSLGGNVLSVRSGQGFRRGVARQEDKLTADDVEALKRDVPSVTAIVPELSVRKQVKLGNQNRSLNIVGTTPEFAEVHRFEMLYGRMISQRDVGAKRRVALLGGAVPADFEIDPTQLIGQRLLIQGTSYEIIGIFEEKGSVMFDDQDKNVWIPISTAQYRVAGTDNLGKIGVQIAPGIDIGQAMIDVERVLRREHQIIPGARNDFNLFDSKLFLQMQQEATKIFSYLLTGIAGISLIVGGIGIMNIMLVTVTERTREIGIRKAMGATRANIMVQFLIEAMSLCVAGGAIGIILGGTASTLLANLAGWQTPVSVTTVTIAFVFSAGVGLFFGIWPASKAARLDPIAALRYE